MVVSDRNVWDPKTPTDPPGYTDLTKRSFVVDLCVYLLERSAKDERMVRADVQAAASTWCKCDINIQVVNLERLGPLPPSQPPQEGQIDLNAPDLADQSIPCTPPDVVREQFLDLARRRCGNLTETVPVFYVPGHRFQGGGSGCHMYYNATTDVSPEHLILLTDDANGSVLAHELGHALFTRRGNAQTWINHDPDPNRDPNPNNQGHNLDPANLMFPDVPDDPVVSAEQCAQARQCHLTHERELVFGFVENKKVTLGVRIDKLTVHRSDDEATSDDALESDWTFKASIVDASNAVVASKEKPWHMDPLHWWTYSFDNVNQPSMDLSPLEISSGTDKLVIEAGGTDWDFWSPNDQLPPVKKELQKGTDRWGADNTNIPNGQPGTYRERPSSGDIEYSLEYNVRVIDQPRETIFRHVC